MPICIDPDSVEEFVCECDRDLPKREQRIWFLGIPTESEQNEIQEALFECVTLDEDGKPIELKQQFGLASIVVRAGLRGWKNVKAESKGKSKVMKYRGDEDKRPADWSMTCIPALIKTEIMNAVLRRMQLMPEVQD